ncbi:ABC-2 type transporter [Fragilaria crotonensis]|nr:ABC-2 type transporter [Fragilaria crotonensis]
MAPVAGPGTSPSKGIHKISSLALEAREHPYTTREGKTITWQNVNLVLAGEKEGKDRQLLDQVWGEAQAKQTTAIMGPRAPAKLHCSTF